MTKFNIIASICQNGGIGCRGYIPWINSTLYINMFERLTRGNGNNAVLMGGNTYNYIWSNQYLPFHGRRSLIWSRNIFHDEPSHCHNMEYIDNLDKVISNNKYDEVWIIGGEKMYSSIVKENIQIKNIYLNYIDKEYKCDLFFPFEIFHKNDKFHVIEKRIVNNTDQYIMKVERELYY